MQNPFTEHDANMAEYQVTLSPKVGGASGNFINAAVFAANGSGIASAQYPATVSHFVVQQFLVNGGFSPRLSGQAIVRKSALPAGAYFKTGTQLTVTQVGGSVRQCQIENVEDTFTEWRLNLWDVNQNA